MAARTGIRMIARIGEVILAVIVILEASAIWMGAPKDTTIWLLLSGEPSVSASWET